MKPLIGITTGVKNDQYTVFTHYARWIMRCGGVPVIIPVETEFDPALYDYLDGLILSGGPDIDPSYYGQEPERTLGIVNPARDEFEFALLPLFASKPVLGICRGMQLINVHAGGSLFQDIYTSQGSNAYLAHKLHSQNEEEPLMHSLVYEENSYFGKLVGTPNLRVMSTHHQAINEVAEGLEVSAISKDGVIEVIYGTDPNRFVLGLQWHPEKRNFTDKDSFRIFTAFIEACREYKSKAIMQQ